MKPDDKFATPLCLRHHDEHHRIGRHSFERKYGLDLAAEAAFLATAGEMP